MRTDKWLYFRTVADVDNDDGVDTVIDRATSAMIPSNRLINMAPQDDTTLRLEFYAVKYSDTAGSRYRRSGAPHIDHVDITIGTNKHKEVMQSITSAINSPSRTPFITIADDAVTDVNNNTIKAEYLSNDITACGNIYCYETPQGAGMHEYYAVVSPVGGTTDSTNDVVATVPITLPNEVVILEAALYPLTLADNDVGSVALEYHTAAIADDDASAGVEIVGADTLNLSIQGVTNAAGTKDVDNTSVPDADLDISSNATVGKGIHSGVMDPIATGANTTYLHVVAKEDMATMTGTPIVGVYVRWWGKAATALA